MADVDPHPDAAEAADVYKAFRKLSLRRLWEEVPRFETLPAPERVAQAGLIRALGVVVAAHGSDEDRARLRSWLCGLLDDPAEKIRRYAIHALPKLGSGEVEEAALLGLLGRTVLEREKGYLREALEKIGGRASLEYFGRETPLDASSRQRLQANIVRRESPGGVLMDAVLADTRGLRIHLRCRRGLEGFVREELETNPRTRDRFRVIEAGRGLVALRPLAAFTLGDLYSLRCCASVGFVVGLARTTVPRECTEAYARAIASPLTRRLLRAFHEGPPRYRLELLEAGARQASAREVAARAFALCPEILNDSHRAAWSIDIHPTKAGQSVELRARLSPDPRFTYRVHDVAAASHPPLAAGLARWAGRTGKPGRIWDPFCGSGLELIESALLGGVGMLYGSDLSGEAVAIAQTNLSAAGIDAARTCLRCCDFREFPEAAGVEPGSLSLVISNPPLGRRIRIPDLRGLLEDLFRMADRMLEPGGRLVFTNPLKMESPVPSLRLEARLTADLGGFDCRLEKYRKTGR